VRPVWLANTFSWQEFCHYWLDVENRCPVDRIEFGNKKLSGHYSNDPANGASDAIGPILDSLSEYSHCRPVLVVPWMADTDYDFRGFNLVKPAEYFNMSEL
jgi:hypothetical protein